MLIILKSRFRGITCVSYCTVYYSYSYSYWLFITMVTCKTEIWAACKLHVALDAQLIIGLFNR